MPILFLVKRSRRRLFLALRRLVEKPGVVAVLLDRRQRARRRRHEPIPFGDRRSVSRRHPLDADALRTWATLGFMVHKVHALPEGPAPPRRAGGATKRRSATRRRP